MMSVGPLPPTGNVAGSPLAQSVGSDSGAKKEIADKGRAQSADRQAEQAAGIGRTEQDSEADDRDADGRLAWELPDRKAQDGEQEDAAEETEQPKSRDVEGLRGNRLDLSI